MDGVTPQQRRRLAIVRYYMEYVRALADAYPETASTRVQESRRALARAIEAASAGDDDLVTDFRRAFTAPRTH